MMDSDPIARYTTLPQWPPAYQASGASATLKRSNEDFRVTELPLQQPCGEGEHLWLEVEKNGANTVFGAQRFGYGGGNVEQGRALLARGHKAPVRSPCSISGEIGMNASEFVKAAAI